EDIKPESRFMEDLGFSSFDFMSMLGEVEDELEVEIDQEEAANIRTVQEAVDYLESLQ
ncbi:MAG: acyl carrier protein, partial [Lachnospiraceae bacterium]|nr:acyl carrier protein [Lachnospiraceae bacterium]